MTPTDEQCDAIVASTGLYCVVSQDDVRKVARAAFAAGVASVAVPRGKHSKECNAQWVNGGLYCMCAAPAAQDQQEKKRLAAIEFANPCQCAACVAARDKMDAMCAPAPARQDQSGEARQTPQEDREASGLMGVAASPDPTPAPVDKTANPQGSPVDKSPESQGESRDDASYATEYADPAPAPELRDCPHPFRCSKVGCSQLGCKGNPTPAPDDLVARLQYGHWSDCALYTADPSYGLDCDCGHPLRMGAAARIVEQDKRIAELVATSNAQIVASANRRAERAEARLAEATKLLQWLDSKGGLGLDVHELIRAFLKGEK